MLATETIFSLPDQQKSKLISIIFVPLLCKRFVRCDNSSVDKDTKIERDEAKTGSDDHVTSSNDNICSLPVDIGICKSYQVRLTYCSLLLRLTVVSGLV